MGNRAICTARYYGCRQSFNSYYIWNANTPNVMFGLKINCDRIYFWWPPTTYFTLSRINGSVALPVYHVLRRYWQDPLEKPMENSNQNENNSLHLLLWLHPQKIVAGAWCCRVSSSCSVSLSFSLYLCL